MKSNDIEGWLILRCSGRHTMSLAASLAKDGFDVWTPIETKQVRVPRMNIRREVRLPIMPSYVFARMSHLVELLGLAALPIKPRRGAGRLDPAHASFSVMHWENKIPVVADRHLHNLRRIEAKRTPIKRAAYSFPRDTVARVGSGVFGGLEGVVVRSTPLKTVVSFAKGREVEIPTSLLEIPVLQAGQPDEGDAAQEAA